MELDSGVLLDLEEAIDRFRKRASESGDISSNIFVKEDADSPVAYKATSLKSMLSVPDVEEIKALSDRVGIEWRETRASRVIPYWASDERVDSHGDIVRQDWDFSAFEKNSPMPWNHGWDGPPVGKAIKWEVMKRTDGDYDGPALHILGMFAEKDEFEWADTVYRLAKAGFLTSGSVGFAPGKIVDVSDEKERKELGLGPWGFVLESNKLLEFSPTLIGANDGAHTVLAHAKSKGLVHGSDMTAVREILRRDAIIQGKKDSWREIDREFIAQVRTLFPRYDFEKHEDPEEPFIKQEEDRTVGVSIPVEKVSVEERLERIETVLEESLKGLSVIVSDIRDSVESLQSKSARSTDHINANEGNELSDEVMSTLDSVFSELKGRFGDC